MFDNLTKRLNDTIRQLSGAGRLTQENIQDSLREVRRALLEADVALSVVKDFIDAVSEKALGQEVLKSLSPGQALVKIVHDELVEVLGGGTAELNLKTQPPAVILMAGLQGSGKTTSTAKLARHLIESQKKSVMVVSADVYRPAAIAQLERVAGEVGAQFFPSDASQKPEKIAKAALAQAKRSAMDVLIVDTAGRLHVDSELMEEIQRLHKVVDPVETLFVVDAMTGQDAAVSAKAFHDALPLTGVVLTKVDGDARGGAALSIRQVTGRPIKFMGVGEKVAALEPFHPDRIASRILGMGDVLSLVEQAQATVDQDKAEKLAKKMSKGKVFSLNDFKDQLEQMLNMGGMASLMDKLPGMSDVPDSVKNQVNDQEFKRSIAIICSMTKLERRRPNLINGSRKKRIAAGSGTRIQDVNKLLKQFLQMQKMMKKVGKGGMKGMMRGLGGMKGMAAMKGKMPGMPF